ncbi:SDR family NAD(P)-dependent oxidoreductase [Parafrankia sp. FMc6]|uniref:SDR family NAD(P)-dependent oxidoreductase n=1 Tax=Parafrankia soli TaxID=2599596 RepID=UPI0034D5B9C9
MRFDGRVAIVTGGGRGMGRAHCLELARRGAKVVVNDLGAELDGSGSSATVADEVRDEITAAGGVAVSSNASVAGEEGAAAIAQTALDAFGRIDVLVHNAGPVTYAPFSELTYQQYRDLVSVHLDGGFLMAKAVWPPMQRSGYGRLVFVTSQAALGGTANLAHYAAAKNGVVGLARVLAIEGAEYGIRANALGVAAYTRMTAAFFEPVQGGRPDVVREHGEQWWRRYLRPDAVSPVVAFLSHEDCQLSGEILDTGGGHTSFQFLATTQGFCDLDPTAESVRDHLETILDPADHRVFHPATGFLDWRNGKLREAGASLESANLEGTRVGGMHGQEKAVEQPSGADSPAVPLREPLDRAVRRLVDRNEIIDLVHRYSYLVDHRLYDELAELFTEDCVVDYGPAVGPPVRGRGAFRAMFGGGDTPRGFLATSHHNANVLVTFEDDDRAGVLTSVYAWHRATKDITPRVWGCYRDVAVHTPGGWRLAERQLRVAGTESWPGEWHPLKAD